MKITALKRFADAQSTETVTMRGTDAQDHSVSDTTPWWRKNLKLILAAAGSLVALLVFIWLARAWSQTDHMITAERMRVATVERGPFVRDVAAQGTVIAAVSPTLFATAPGTISYAVRAGDTVKKGQLLATLDSPALRNEYERERASLDGVNAALARQEIEIRRQILASKQQADLARVAIQAAERELKRAQAAWDERVISERDYREAIDAVSTAKLNYDHARDTAGLEQDSLTLDLRTRRLERDQQALVVANLKRQVDELDVRSPVDGMVANLAQAERAKILESAPLLTVVDLSAFEIEFKVAETYAREIKPGMPSELTLDNRKYAGTVTAISPEVRESEVTGRVKFTGEQPPGLRQNQRASVRIVLDERRDVLKFDRGSLIDSPTRFVYVAKGDRAVRTPVELGSASITEVEVIRGLNPGDRIVISDTRDFGDAPELVIAD
jgi:HlyD family secretion protein